MHGFWQQTWVELDKHRTITQHTGQASLTKGNRRNDCARKEEACAALLKSGRLLLKAEERSLSRSQKEAGMTRLLFSIFVVFDNKKRRDEGKWWELQAILYLDNRGDDCVLLSIHGFQTKRQPHLGSLLGVYRSLTQGHTKALHSPHLYVRYCAMHVVIVPASEKDLPRLLRFETDTESLSYDAFGQNKPLLLNL